MAGLFETTSIPAFVSDSNTGASYPGTYFPLAATLEACLFFGDVRFFIPLVIGSEGVLNFPSWDVRFIWERDDLDSLFSYKQEVRDFQALIKDLIAENVIRLTGSDALLIYLDHISTSPEGGNVFEVRIRTSPILSGDYDRFEHAHEQNKSKPSRYDIDESHYVEFAHAKPLSSEAIRFVRHALSSDFVSSYLQAMLAELDPIRFLRRQPNGVVTYDEAADRFRIETSLLDARLFEGLSHGFYNKDPQKGLGGQRFILGHMIADVCRPAVVGSARSDLLVCRPERQEISFSYAEPAFGSRALSEAARQVGAFQEAELGEAAAVRHALTSGAMNAAEIRKLFENAPRWKSWITSIGEDRKLAFEYLQETRREPFMSSLPGRLLRFGVPTAAGLALDLMFLGGVPVFFTGSLVALGAGDAIWGDRLRGWSPKFYWDEVKEQVNPSDSR